MNGVKKVALFVDGPNVGRYAQNAGFPFAQVLISIREAAKKWGDVEKSLIYFNIGVRHSGTFIVKKAIENGFWPVIGSASRDYHYIDRRLTGEALEYVRRDMHKIALASGDADYVTLATGAVKNNGFFGLIYPEGSTSRRLIEASSCAIPISVDPRYIMREATSPAGQRGSARVRI